MQTEPVRSKEKSKQDNVEVLSLKFRLMGVLPLIFFLAQLVYYWRANAMANMLWMCNIGNLMLAVGLFLGYRELIRVAAIWMIPGLVVWFVYVLLPSGFLLTSTMAHLGGFGVAIIALRKVRVDRIAWLHAFIWYLALQAISRLITSPDANVNVAHSIYYGWAPAFGGSFWKFWLVMTLLVAAGLWVLGSLLNLFWPPLREPQGTSG